MFTGYTKTTNYFSLYFSTRVIIALTTAPIVSSACKKSIATSKKIKTTLCNLKTFVRAGFKFGSTDYIAAALLSTFAIMFTG